MSDSLAASRSRRSRRPALDPEMGTRPLTDPTRRQGVSQVRPATCEALPADPSGDEEDNHISQQRHDDAGTFQTDIHETGACHSNYTAGFSSEWYRSPQNAQNILSNLVVRMLSSMSTLTSFPKLKVTRMVI